MAIIYKFPKEPLEDLFKLIAVHCSLDAYALAYHLNQTAGLRLKRKANDLNIGGIDFPVYEYEDLVQRRTWRLVANKSLNMSFDTLDNGLFQELPQGQGKSNYLINERKDIDFILKGDCECDSVAMEMVGTIHSLPKVRLAYQLDNEKLNTKYYQLI